MINPDLAPAAVIATTNLSKRYGAVAALDGLDLAVPPGVIYGFLGPNGAGKTTAIRLLLGFIRPSAGAARLNGFDCWHDGVNARRELGYLVSAESLYPDLSGRDQLDFAARLAGRPPVLRSQLLAALELSESVLGRRLGTYSKGMRQKLALIAAIQHDPAILILDEPTDGLDPLIQHAFEQVLLERRRAGRTIFMSSHDLGEVERICDRVAVVRGGQLILEGAVAELTLRHRRQAVIRFAGPPPDLTGLPQVSVIATEGNMATVSVEGEVAALVRYLATTDLVDLFLPPPRLEDIFLGLYDTDQPLAAPGASREGQ